MRTFQFKLYRTDRNAKLHNQINCTGLTYNHCIALHKRYYKLFGKYLKKGNFKYFQSRKISGKIKTITIKRDTLGDFYVYFVTDAKNFKVETRTGKRVDFDFGLKTFLTESDGNDIISPMFFARNSRLIAKANKNLL